MKQCLDIDVKFINDTCFNKIVQWSLWNILDVSILFLYYILCNLSWDSGNRLVLKISAVTRTATALATRHFSWVLAFLHRVHTLLFFFIFFPCFFCNGANKLFFFFWQYLFHCFCLSIYSKVIKGTQVKWVPIFSVITLIIV